MSIKKMYILFLFYICSVSQNQPSKEKQSCLVRTFVFLYGKALSFGEGWVGLLFFLSIKPFKNKFLNEKFFTRYFLVQ
ncbi:MAG: hypothetical protein RLZZ292_3970 [Bacteroidota bacterium]|jgi:hypothetical protein